jgi:very-short-patch-repair endonuclease
MSTPLYSSSTMPSTSAPITGAPPQAAAAARIAASVESWQRRLLDLTKRNRALSFKVNRVATITVVDEQPAEVFRQLYVREQPMKFKAAPEPETEQGEERADPASAASGESGTPSDSAGEWSTEAEDDVGALALDFAPYDATSLDERHTDEWLQTTSTPESLDKSLRRLDEQARLSVEEQGVNTLFLALGMLHYLESSDSEQVLRAPLVLLPVELSRKSARTGYTLRIAEDEPMVNPALAEYLRRDHGIALPELPDPSAMPDDYDLQEVLTAAAAAVREKKGWSVKTDIYLALFSFQKFAMYKDLEANGESLKQHRLIRQLVTRSSNAETQVMGLPGDVREMTLDEEYPPEKTFQVVDADSSQLRAIAASSRNYDLVIEGPPGTGKSQTITNLIAQALSVGKSVLFVAEKMAALSVVHDRLVRAKLGEFCLELHSTKANKRAVMKELAAALDASLQTVAAPTVSTQRLPQVRATLTEYAKAVHTPHGSLGISPYRAYGELGRVIGAPRVKYQGPVDQVVTSERIEQAVRDLRDLAAAASEVEVPSQHPWRDTARTFYTEDDLESVRDLATSLAARLEEVARRAAAVREAFNLPPVATFADVETAAAIAEVLARSPGAPLAVIASDAWNQPPAEAGAMIERGRALDELKARVAKSFIRDALEQEHASDIAYIEQKSQGFLSFLAFLDGRYRSVKKRWLLYRLPGYQGTLADQANEMKQVDRLRAERQAIAGLEQQGRELFGGLWQGERSSWDVLENYVRWVVEFRGVCVRHGLSGKAFEAATKAAPDVSDIEALRTSAGEALPVLESLRQAVSWPADYLSTAPLGEIASRTSALANGVRLAPRWAAFEAARQVAAESLAGELLPMAMNGEIPFRDLAPAFLRAFYLKWLSHIVQHRSVLERFHTMAHEQRVQEFRELDERVLLENRAALVGELRDRVQHALQSSDAAAQMPYLRRELARQRGLSPLRRTMRQAGTAIRAIKPCLMMSPLTVAQLLDGSAPSFDLIIFDEASQLPTEEAVGAIIRGKQLVVVGDPKQLPPTNFFSVSTGTSNADVGDDGQPLVEDSESILEEFMGAGVPMSRLKWHYRSAHESLISFSNVQFYESDLYTFPSVETGNETYGLQFEYLPDGVYEGKGLNAVEARRVADEIVRFAKEQLERRALSEPTQSLGVGTFNMRQQLAILDELEQRRRADPSIEPFFDRGTVEPFFVKNLENIQGDERDVIFISVTYARATDGKLRYNFGPLNGENGWRRLNVLITRARQRMKVFSSMKGDEINAAATTSRGAYLLREFLLFAERGRLESVSASLTADTESPFERDVLTELTNRGIKVVPQVGVAGYRIDLAVLDDEVPGRFLCGIECDGVAYHSSETARDRDRLRQQVLEARGWLIYRVWSTDWFKDRSGQIERLLKLIEEARSLARQEADAEKQARARKAEESVRRASEEAEAAQREAEALVASGVSAVEYERPIAEAYVVTPGERRYAGADLLEAPLSQRVQAVVVAVETESPIHEMDLITRVASMWGMRAGSRIQGRILDACGSAERSRVVQRRGQFFWNVAGVCHVRSRAETRIPAERIAPEEYQEAVLMVLAGGHGFSRSQLTTEVRSVFGFKRTGAALDEAIGGAIDTLLTQGKIGEASTGIRLRR